MPFTAIFIKSHFTYFLQVIIIPIGTFDIINQPSLVGKAILKMSCNQRKSILFRFHSSKKSPVRRFLKTYKLKQAQTFPIHTLPHTRKGQYIRIGKVCLNGTGSIYSFTDVTKQKQSGFLFFSQPTLGQTSQGR